MTAGFGEKGQPSLPMFFHKEIFVFGPQTHNRAHIHLIVCGQHCGCILTVLKAARDGLAQTGHFYRSSRRIIHAYWCARSCAASAVVWVLAIALAMSSFIMRPSRPVPVT